MKILITGSNGLIGGEAVEYFGGQGHQIIGLDNNMRRQFFGPMGDTFWNRDRLKAKVPKYTHYMTDIRYFTDIETIFKIEGPFDAVIHCAAQPSHDKAREIPILDHAVNATGTLNMLEATRLYSPEAVFIFTSTNKVYGDAPNELPIREHQTRWDYRDSEDSDGVTENFRIDDSTHSIFGANKLAADIMTQEYAKTYGLKTVVFRGGCLTGPGHSGVELHGFLSYLVKIAITGGHYKVYGYKSKQVRDNIHSYDVVRAFEEVILDPYLEVYNIGGGRENSVSILEAISKIEQISGKKISWEYIDENRLGDHICYITDMKKFKQHYPEWKVTKSLDNILEEMVRSYHD